MSEAESAKNGFYFLSLEVENVCCFGKKQTLNLFDSRYKDRPAQWTVILGDNGTGKTTLLQLLTEGIGISPYRKNSFCRINTDKSIILSIFAFNSTITNKKDDFLKFSYETTLVANEARGNFESDIPITSNEITDWHPSRIHYTPGTLTYKVGNFRVTNSMLLRFPYSANRKLKNNSAFLYRDTQSFNEKSELINAEEWLKETYLFSKANSKFTNHFSMVKETLINLLPDVDDIDVYYPDENKPELEVRFLLNKVWLSLDVLSLGYQSMIAWVVDLVARLFKYYSDSTKPIEEPAVVLIDEIDLHLHPKWQREIMRYLSDKFKNTQFIVTAHSPLIVQAAEDENANIVVLRREGDEVIIDQRPKAIHGWRVDQLLASDLFGLKGSRSPKSEERLKERDDILNKPELTETDKKKLEELRYIPMAESPEDIEAMSIIREAAKLLKEKYK